MNNITEQTQRRNLSQIRSETIPILDRKCIQCALSAIQYKLCYESNVLKYLFNTVSKLNYEKVVKLPILVEWRAYFTMYVHIQ